VIEKRKVHKLFVDFSLFLLATYLLFEKVIHFSISSFLKSVFTPNCYSWIFLGLKILSAYTILASIVYWIKKKTGSDDNIIKVSNPFLRCLIKINSEIKNHIGLIKEKRLKISEIDGEHKYESNIGLLIQNLHEHIIDTLKEHSLHKGDLFISFYHEPTWTLNFDNIKTLNYHSHFDPSIFQTTNKQIDISQSNLLAGAKAFQTGNFVLISKIEKKNFNISGNERRKTVKHFIGIPIKIDASPVALINIEFHKNIFKNYDEMLKYFRNEIMAFVYLFEYQMHKKYFFHNLEKEACNVPAETASVS
jgi:hypothetical protein